MIGSETTTSDTTGETTTSQMPLANGSQPLAGSTRVDLASGYYVDLDSGAMDKNTDEMLREADLHYDGASIVSAASFNSNSPGRMAILGADPATPQTCAHATRYTSSINLSDLHQGSQLCVRTTSRHEYFLRLEHIPDSSEDPSVVTLVIV